MKNPSWYDAGLATIGTKEVPGVANSPTILGWAKKLTAKVVGMVYNADSTPWCGLWMAYCMNEAGITPPPVPVRAMSWATWGANLRADRLAPGAVLVFQRKGGGHVAQYVGEDELHYHVMGGNQGDAVSVTRIEKARCVARRWPSGVAVTGTPVWIKGSKAAVSTNEA